MLVDIRQNQMGDIEAVPVNLRIRRKIIKHLASFKVQSRNGSAYFQGDAAEKLINDLPKRVRADVRGGWRVRVRMDSWTFGCYVGWDTCEVL